MAKDRLQKYLAIKRMDIEKKIELLKDVYREIDLEDVKKHDLLTYITLYSFSFSSHCFIVFQNISCSSVILRLWNMLMKFCLNC